MQKKQRTLVVTITNKCNKDCSFCLADDYMQLDMIDKKTRKELFSTIFDENPQLTTIAWSGGEPLLEPRLLRELFEIAKLKRPDISNVLFTNGMALRASDIDLYSQMTRINVSIDGFESSERNLVDFAKNNKYEAFEVINSLNNVMIKSVVTNEQLNNMRWHEDVVKMHNNVHHLGLNHFGIALNHKTTVSMTVDQAINLVYGHSMIDQSLVCLNKQNNKNTSLVMEKLFQSDEPCRCYGSVMSYTDGTVEYEHERDNIIQSGCSVLAKAVGIETYKLLNNIFNVPFAG